MRYDIEIENDHFQILVGDRVRGPSQTQRAGGAATRRSLLYRARRIWRQSALRDLGARRGSRLR